MSGPNNYQFGDAGEKISFVLVGLTLVTLLLGACAPPASDDLPQATQPPAVSHGNEIGGYWKLVSFGWPGAETQGAATPVIEGSTITLEFDAGGQAGGSGGCNSYSAQYEAQQNMLSFGQITSTLMACEQEGIDQQEQRYFQALETAGAFELAEDHLVIWHDDGQGVLYFVRWLGSTGTPRATPTPSWTAEPISTPTSAADQPTPTPQRIAFETGATSATVRGDLQASGSAFYVLRALEGQTMTVQLSFTEGQAILAIWGADGTVLMSDHAEASSFSGVLPSTQDYYILLKGRPDGETDYRMEVTIPPLRYTALYFGILGGAGHSLVALSFCIGIPMYQWIHDAQPGRWLNYGYRTKLV